MQLSFFGRNCTRIKDSGSDPPDDTTGGRFATFVRPQS